MMSPSKEGVLLRIIGGFGDVLSEDGEETRCRIRGKFKLKNDSLLVGDWVRITVINSGEGVIEEILPRHNRIWRPSVANLDQLLAVVSAQSPPPDWLLLDRQLVQAEKCGIDPLICVNKIDMLTKEELKQIKEKLNYLPYPSLLTVAISGDGISKLEKSLQGKTTVLAGPSGSGKSTLLNSLQPELQLETAEVSHKLNRGKHTTRRVELFPLKNGGLVVDTPGFSKLSLPVDAENLTHEDLELGNLFPEFEELTGGCKFRSCLHENEPDCAVREAAEKSEISPQRYQHYLLFLKEIREEQAKRMR